MQALRPGQASFLPTCGPCFLKVVSVGFQAYVPGWKSLRPTEAGPSTSHRVEANRPATRQLHANPTARRARSGTPHARRIDARCARVVTCTGATALPSTHPAPPTRRYVELFAGIGGFRIALDSLGGRCALASEIDTCAAATYTANFGGLVAGDITDVPCSELPAHDLLTGGFPCQSFSRGGAQHGLKDEERGGLFQEVIRVARACQPAALLLENVPNLLRVDNGHAMHEIVTALTAAGCVAPCHLFVCARSAVPLHM